MFQILATIFIQTIIATAAAPASNRPLLDPSRPKMPDHAATNGTNKPAASPAGREHDQTPAPSPSSSPIPTTAPPPTILSATFSSPDQPSMVMVRKSAEGCLLINDWEIATKSHHEIEDSVAGFLQRAILDLRHHCVMAESVQHLLDEQIAELEAFLDSGEFEWTVHDASGESEMWAIGDGRVVASGRGLKTEEEEPVVEKLVSATRQDELGTAVFYYCLLLMGDGAPAAPAPPGEDGAGNLRPSQSSTIVPPVPRGGPTPSGTPGLTRRTPSFIQRGHEFAQCFQTADRKLNSVDVSGFVEYLKNGAKNVIVLCGAGISTSAGIPDFRSKGGLFDQIQEAKRRGDPSIQDLVRPEQLFEVSGGEIPASRTSCARNSFLRWGAGR